MSWWLILAFQLLLCATAAGWLKLGRVKYKQMSNFLATRSPEPTAYENLAKATWACASLASEKKKKKERSLVKENVKLVGCGHVNVLMAMANSDTFTLRFLPFYVFDQKTTPRTLSTEDTVLTEKKFPDRSKLLAKRTSKPMYIKWCWGRGCHGNLTCFPVKRKPSFLK